MRILTWNAAMRFRDKIEQIIPFKADILVIPECESPEKWKGNHNSSLTKEFLWFGDNPNKGLGILVLNEANRIERHPSYNSEFRYIVPLKVSGKEGFILFAIWSQNTPKQY